MPGSLVDIRYIPDFQQFMGQELYFKIIELNRNVIRLSSRGKQALEESQKRKDMKHSII